MSAFNILIEHTKSDKKGEGRRRYLSVEPEQDMFLIGSSQKADLRITGDGIEGCHAVLKYRAPHWYLCDLSGSETIFVGSQAVTEQRLDQETAVRIGVHSFKLFPKEKSETLFGEPSVENKLDLHQVVVRSHGRVIETHLLKASESYRYADSGETGSLGSGEIKILPAPTTGQWSITQVSGNRMVQQRLVARQDLVGADSFEVDRNLLKPFLILLFFAIAVTSVVSLMPKTEKPVEAQLDRKSIEMIYSAKTIKKKRSEAVKVAASKVKAGGTSEASQAQTQPTSVSMPEESVAPKANPQKATQAVTNLRNSGLSSLIGKIAKRANKTGVMIAATGVSPDQANSGRAFYSTGTTTVGGGGEASKAGESFRLGGIATKGKAGGAGDFKDGTSLVGGKVGQGELSVVEEETSIEGGLDRDVIADVIRKHLGEIRYCYERQLSSNRDLYGKVMVKFEIDAKGALQSPRVDSSTMKNAMVEGCMMRRMAAWQFPLPRGGTTVKVSYPFLFKAQD